MIGKKTVKIIGWAATLLGIGTTLVSEWVNEQKMNEIIDEKINEAFAKKNEGKEEES